MTGCVLIDLAGTTLSSAESDILRLPQVAGVVLFSKNYVSQFQLMGLVHAIRAANPNALVLVDQEGGSIQRFGAPDFSLLPSAYALGQSSIAHAKEIGEKMASELLACGIDASLAPVLDLHTEDSVIIGQKHRAFHEKVDQVIAYALAFVEGMNHAGMSATGKHFPGHGQQCLDSHTSQLIDRREWEMLQDEMQPFLALKDQLAAWMPAHITYPAVDDVVVGRSMVWKQKIREELGFSGALISDCLSMAGAVDASSLEERASEVQYWVDTLRSYASVCDLVIMTHLESAPGAIDLAQLEQILLTALPSDVLKAREDRGVLLKGHLKGEFCRD